MKRLAAAALATFALVAGTARAQPPIGFTVSASAPTPMPALPSAEEPNQPGSISVPTAFTTPPANAVQLGFAQLQSLWQRAGAAYGIPWQVLAAINKIESNFGQNMGPSSAGAIGWMQFMPSTWLRWGTDADGNGVADPWTPTDGIFSAARYLAAAGGRTDIERGVFAYNHADWYVNEVLSLARVYGSSAPAQTADLQQLQASLDDARAKVAAASRSAVAADVALRRLRARARALHAQAARTLLLSDRLSVERRAAELDGRVIAVAERAAAKRNDLTAAVGRLRTARHEASAPSFSPGVGTLLAAPAYSGRWVFPVGGGPQTVSVGHTHHDYPAADIAAPAGAPVYALADGLVENAWHLPDARCGIGMTFRSNDGRSWTYCHLSYLEPSVTDGVTLSAGAAVGLVGSTGHATGPHLHLQLRPATSYPQAEAWFEQFAGTAFRWQDAPTPERSLQTVAAPQQRVFTVVEEAAPVIRFTR